VVSRNQSQSAFKFRFIHSTITVPCLKILNAKAQQTGLWKVQRKNFGETVAGARFSILSYYERVISAATFGHFASLLPAMLNLLYSRFLACHYPHGTMWV